MLVVEDKEAIENRTEYTYTLNLVGLYIIFHVNIYF